MTDENDGGCARGAATTFEDVRRSELAQIARLRRHLGGSELTASQIESSLVGLCLSGGGIRSATFGLGVVQALAKAGWLSRLDYISSVSGGGYVAAWLGAWIRRAGGVTRVEKLLDAPVSPSSWGAASERIAEPPEVRFLRTYSNYLTPQVGLASGDVWAAAAIYLRNLLLNLLVLVLSMSTLLLVPRIASLGFRELVAGSHGGGLRAFAAASLFVVIATVVVGRSLHLFQHPPAGDAKPVGQPALPSKAWVYVAVVVPLFGAAIGFCACLRALRQYPLEAWLAAGALVYLASWMSGYFAANVAEAYRRSRRKAASSGGAPERWRRAVQRHGWVLEDAMRRDRPTWRAALAVLASAVFSGALAGGGLRGLVSLLEPLPDHPGSSWHIVALGPPLVITITLVATILQVGLIGKDMPDTKREWLGRMGGGLMLCALSWLASFAVAIYLPLALSLVWQTDWAQGLWGKLTTGSVLTGWLGVTLAGVVTGAKGTSYEKQPKPGAGIDSATPPSKLEAPPRHERKQQGRQWPRELLLKVAPYAFVAGMVALLSVAVHRLLAPDHSGAPAPTGWLAQLDAQLEAIARNADASLLAWFGSGAALSIIFAWRVDINQFSMHQLYRNRLIRCYLGASNAARNAHPFTGLDPADDIPLEQLSPDPPAADVSAHVGPYQIFNASLNLVRGEALAWQKRRASSFIMTPLWCGYHRSKGSGSPRGLDDHGYVPTSEYASQESAFSLGTAMAISGAAVSPNMGYYSSSALAFLLTVFNVRLGWWLPNPRRRDARAESGPPFGLFYLFFELFALTNDRRDHVYLSDGGHFDNLGLYELVRRRCRTILIADGSADPEYAHDDLANAIQRCRVDFGATLSFPDAGPFGTRESVSIGTVTYIDGTQGVLVYLKPSLAALNESSRDVAWYREHVDQRFPHQSTADQWFDEAQFESYRALGEQVMRQGLEQMQALPEHAAASPRLGAAAPRLAPPAPPPAAPPPTTPPPTTPPPSHQRIAAAAASAAEPNAAGSERSPASAVLVVSSDDMDRTG